MSDLLPLATYSLNVEPYTPVPAIDVTMPITVRITMAALNPEAIDEENKPSTLRIIKRNPDFEDDDFLGGDFDEDEIDEESSEEEEEEKTQKKKKSKGKKAESESEDDEEDADEDDEFQESVLLTLSPEAQYQQSLDLTITPEEEVQFIVTGSYAISLSGNYVKHPFDTPMGVEGEDEDEDADIYDSEDYDLTPDEDEIIGDDMDDLDDEEEEEVRIEEVQEEEEEEQKEEVKPEPKKSKKEKKRKHEEKEEEKKAKKVKKVEFKKDLEEGPTKPKSKKEQDKHKPKSKVLEGGIVIEDRTIGDGPQAKRGARVGMRYIGKLKNGKVFDKNTSGKPFAFKLGRGEVIKGWDIGVAGMSVGGERRIIIPAPYAYGKQALPGIPANSELTFDVKLVSMKN
ncbi:BAD_collapsed_G0040620.mRNA.1.CDS.1 [Saccharomyces cerevisiae]|nr:CCT_1a_G0040430.mRNA.1.CDS.1 [Saccharomyces cerevisiae]CAI4909313.1 BAD_HP_G0066320.mRNA.1.CDS.1 [Saccharomyces cerevisiae]CAI4925538.1 BAD_HP_G0012600.mRNA.1.CDS.1 [Saccharomyces cerevisiae]CAI4960474.1 BAD_HP_G0036770.mRNA.1.CDS.1 [Saccharomyces cerevisiae]CAI6392388.1 BAD_HP_G0066320.mRNA.1.CDS.1 [Saccharomyces cerevisiae]